MALNANIQVANLTLILSIVALVTTTCLRAADSLVGKASRSMISVSSKKDPSQLDRLEFTGIVKLGDQVTISLYDRTSNQGFSIPVGGMEDGFSVNRFDSARGTIQVSSNDRIREIPIRHGVIKAPSRGGTPQSAESTASRSAGATPTTSRNALLSNLANSNRSDRDEAERARSASRGGGSLGSSQQTGSRFDVEGSGRGGAGVGGSNVNRDGGNYSGNGEGGTPESVTLGKEEEAREFISDLLHASLEARERYRQESEAAKENSGEKPQP